MKSVVEIRMISNDAFMHRLKYEFPREIEKVSKVIDAAAEKGYTDVEYQHDRIWTKHLDITLREKGYDVKIQGPGKILILWV